MKIEGHPSNEQREREGELYMSLPGEAERVNMYTP